jgi:polyisoprenoid-binding protein YceI
MGQIKFLCIYFFLFSTTYAKTLDFSSGVSVEYTAKGNPGLLIINGTGAKAKGFFKNESKALNGSFTLNLKEFTSDLEMRDDHLRENYLEVHKSGFDQAKLVINDVALQDFPENGKWIQENFKGMLTLHGVTKEVKLYADLNVVDSIASGKIFFKIKLNDFNINIPSFAGITVAEEVTIVSLLNNKVSP